MDLAGMPLRDQNPNKRDERCYQVKTCPKFKKKQQLDISPQRALIFNSLRNAGCNKQIALTFCKKSLCKFDATKTTDGPREHKIFKVKSQPEKSQQGYYMQQPAYEQQDKFLWSVEEFLNQSDQETVKFQSQFKQKQEESQKDYQQRIGNIRTYYDELDKQFSLQCGKDQNLLERIRQVRSHQKANSQSCYMAYGNLKLFGLGQQVATNRRHHDSLIEQSEIFNTSGLPFQRVLQDKNFVFTENKPEDELLFQSQKMGDLESASAKSSRGKKKQQAEVSRYRAIILKYCNLMKNANIMRNLNKLEDYTEDQKQALIHKQLKKRKTTVIKQSPEQQGLNEMLKEEKNLQMMGKEFNSSKYITQQVKRCQSVDPVGKEDTQLKQYVSDQITNLFGEESENINFSQLLSLSQARQSYQRSHSKKVSALPDPFMQKASGYMDMPQFQSQLLFNKQHSHISYQTMNSSHNRLRFDKLGSLNKMASSTAQSNFFHDTAKNSLPKTDRHSSQPNRNKRKVEILEAFRK